MNIIDYLKGDEWIKEDGEQIVAQARRGETVIYVSTLAFAEVAFVGRGSDAGASEEMIKEFFGRDYVVPINLDEKVGERARALVRSYGRPFGLRPEDAVYIASALEWDIPLLETRDGRMRNLDGRETMKSGGPLTIQLPRYVPAVGGSQPPLLN